MLEWIEETLGIFRDDSGWYDKRLLLHIIKGQHHMALQTQALTDAVAKLSSDVAVNSDAVKALIAAHGDPTGQAAVDAAAASLVNTAGALEATTKAINDALAPPAPAA